MSKLKKQKAVKSSLTPAEKEAGKFHIYILVSFIVIGIAIGLYFIE